MKIFLAGASFNTGNLGVSALAESSIKCILSRWPDAEIKLYASGRKADTIYLEILNTSLQIHNFPVRFSKNIFLPNHFLILFLNALLLKTIRFEQFKIFCIKHNPFLKDIFGIDLVLDITGGDSFSDIYGFRRFIVEFLRKWLVLLFNKPLIFLPQTYGPFNKKMSKYLAVYTLKKSHAIYSRDKASISFLLELLGNQYDINKIYLMPDVAFCLDPKKPKHFKLNFFSDSSVKTIIKVGINISGLIFYGGYTKDNMFNLKIDYKKLIINIINHFLLYKNIVIILIPHVFPPNEFDVESDLNACFEIFRMIDQQYKNRIHINEYKYNQNEIKYIIGLMDFFIGSRMHSCIAAISQCVPAIGLAYSKKFHGVFATVNMDKYVADMRFYSENDIMSIITDTFDKRKAIASQLKKEIPEIKEKLLKIFNNI